MIRGLMLAVIAGCVVLFAWIAGHDEGYFVGAMNERRFGGGE